MTRSERVPGNEGIVTSTCVRLPGLAITCPNALKAIVVASAALTALVPTNVARFDDPSLKVADCMGTNGVSTIATVQPFAPKTN